MSTADRRLELNLVDATIVSKTAGSPAFVLDIRGCTGFVPWFTAGAHSAQPCDEDGDPLPGSTDDALAAGTKVEMASGFYLVTVDGAESLKITKV